MQTRNAAKTGRLVMLEMEPRCHIERTHVTDAGRKAELVAAKSHVVTRIDDVIQQVGAIESNVEVFPLADADGTGGRGVQGERRRAGADIAPGIAPLARRRSGEGIYIERITGGGGIKRPDHFRANLSGDAGTPGGAVEDGGFG